jgi:DNA-binding MarR family transcriptional regulator
MREPERDPYGEAARLRTALRRFMRQTESITRRHGLSPRHYELLLMIKASSSSRSTVSELVELLQLTQSTVTELVQRAEDAGLVRRRPSPDDGRIVHLLLTDEGERRLAGAIAELGPERQQLLALLRTSD